MCFTSCRDQRCLADLNVPARQIPRSCDARLSLSDEQHLPGSFKQNGSDVGWTTGCTIIYVHTATPESVMVIWSMRRFQKIRENTVILSGQRR